MRAGIPSPHPASIPVRNKQRLNCYEHGNYPAREPAPGDFPGRLVKSSLRVESIGKKKLRSDESGRKASAFLLYVSSSLGLPIKTDHSAMVVGSRGSSGATRNACSRRCPASGRLASVVRIASRLHQAKGGIGKSFRPGGIVVQRALKIVLRLDAPFLPCVCASPGWS